MAHTAVREMHTDEGYPEVLFVDDEASQREMYRRRLERAGYNVRLAGSAEAAAEAVRARPPQVVILDIAMPGRDGLSALQELLDIEPGVPVIINTAYPILMDNFLAWAADAYVEKTSDLAPLLSAIRSVVGRVSSS